MKIFLIILNIIFLLLSIYLFYHANKIQLIKSQQQENYNKQLQKQTKEKQAALKQVSSLYDELNQQFVQMQQNINTQIIQLTLQGQQESNKILAAQRQQQEKIVSGLKTEYDNIRKQITLQHQQEITRIQQQLQLDKQQLQNKLINLQNVNKALNEIQKKQEQQQNNIEFHKLSLSVTDLEDVKRLNDLKISFHNPIILSKLIWSQYFQKQTTALCNRVLGNKIICGIYIITNIQTQKKYIGKSVNIAERWKQHCKCGLGIEASSTNLLYQDMQKYGIWNYTFDILEECPPQVLDEKESFWINVYESNKYGLNTNAGKKVI